MKENNLTIPGKKTNVRLVAFCATVGVISFLSVALIIPARLYLNYQEANLIRNVAREQDTYKLNLMAAKEALSKGDLIDAEKFARKASDQAGSSREKTQCDKLLSEIHKRGMK